MMLGHKSESAVATPHVINKHPFGVKKHATTTTKTTKQAAATKPKPQPVVQATPAKAPEQPSAVIAALAAGMPAPIAKALGRHPIVVVSLYNPYSEVDGIAFAEARAGAQMAKVGFLPLSVLSQAQVGKLTEQLGLLPDPGLSSTRGPETSSPESAALPTRRPSRRLPRTPPAGRDRTGRCGHGERALRPPRTSRRSIRRHPQSRRLRRLLRHRSGGLPRRRAQRRAFAARPVHLRGCPPGHRLHDRSNRGPDGPRLRRSRPVAGAIRGCSRSWMARSGPAGR